MRTKSILLTALFTVFYCAALSQRNNDFFTRSADNYQLTFFNQFSYDDFSYRFVTPAPYLNTSFGKRISVPLNTVFDMKDTSLLDTLKAISNIYLVLGSQKNQALQLENLQKIGKSTFLYLNYNSVASLGFIKNSASKNRSFNVKILQHSKFYNWKLDFLIASNFDASSGGVVDSFIVPSYSKRDLQQLDVRLKNDFLKKKFVKIDLQHCFKLYANPTGERKIDLIIQNNLSRFGFLYAGDGYNQYYQNVFYDSLATKDSSSYSWLINNIGFVAKLKSLRFSTQICNEAFDFQILDSINHFNDWSVKSEFYIDTKQAKINASYSKNISNNFRRYNENAKASVYYQLNRGFFSSFKFESDYSSRNVPFVYQKQFSNHFLWNFTSVKPIQQLNNTLTIGVGSNFSVNVSTSIYKNRVYLNELIIPEIAEKKESIMAAQVCYNDTIGNVHLVESAIYSASNSVSFPVIPIQSFTRIGYFFSLFKNNLKVEAGISGNFNDAWYATSYSPALDDFYIQSKKEYGGLIIINMFADFKIKAATVFLKVERVNIGWLKEDSFIRDGYLAPPRTIRFGFSWPLSN